MPGNRPIVRILLAAAIPFAAASGADVRAFSWGDPAAVVLKTETAPQASAAFQKEPAQTMPGVTFVGTPLYGQVNSLTYRFDDNLLTRASYEFIGLQHEKLKDYFADYEQLQHDLSADMGPGESCDVWRNDRYRGDPAARPFALAQRQLKLVTTWRLPRTTVELVLSGHPFFPNQPRIWLILTSNEYFRPATVLGVPSISEFRGEPRQGPLAATLLAPPPPPPPSFRMAEPEATPPPPVLPPTSEATVVADFSPEPDPALVAHALPPSAPAPPAALPTLPPAPSPGLPVLSESQRKAAMATTFSHTHHATLTDIQSLALGSLAAGLSAAAGLNPANPEQLARMDLYMPDAWISLRAASMKRQYRQYTPDDQDALNALTVIVFGGGVVLRSGLSCNAIDRVALISDKDGGVVREALPRDGFDAAWLDATLQDAVRFPSACPVFSGRFLLSDVQAVQKAAPGGEFLLAAFQGSEKIKIYRVKKRFLNQLGL